MKKSVKILLVVSAVAVLCFTALFAFYQSITYGVKLDKNKLHLSSKQLEILDCNGEPAERVSACHKDNSFRLEQLNEKVKYAFIDVEDRRFYSHHGFDYKRIAKATLTNLKARSFKQGASTISQQTVKNTHLSQEKTLRRKLREFKLTNALEKNFSKDEILEKYLNTIYFGHNCFGLNAAASFYFGKEVRELTVADGAVLAGLVRSPNNYSPFKHPENCISRKKSVLNAMKRQGHLTETEYERALSEPLPLKREQSDGERAYFSCVYEELGELAEAYGFTLNGKVRIHTYLNENLQKLLYQTANGLDCGKIIAVENAQTGGIEGYYSNVGTPRRLPASTLKPLLVYAPALEEGLISPATPLLDEKTDFGGYSPKNYDGKFRGYVSARKSLAESLNVPAVRLLSTLGVEKGCQYLEKTGLKTEKADKSLALALGGMSRGYTLLELTNAYATFSQGGIFKPFGFIRKIEIDGRTVYERKVKKSKVFSEETAYLTTDMLIFTAKEGTARKLRSLPFQIGAKTGTNGRKSGNTDAYTLSYTTRHSVGVWLGSINNEPISISGGGDAAMVAYDVHEFLAKTQTPPPFTTPTGIEKIALDKSEYYDKHNVVRADESCDNEHKFYDIFNKKFAPKRQLENFSNPFISTPPSIFQDGRFQIDGRGLPKYYAYRIDRYDYITHTTVYDGGAFDEFIDYPSKDGRYLYTITPYYKQISGTPVVFPEIRVNKSAPAKPQARPNITDKDWWNY